MQEVKDTFEEKIQGVRDQNNEIDLKLQVLSKLYDDFERTANDKQE